MSSVYVIDNPVTTVGLKEDECYLSSSNTQFQYETKLGLDAQLQMEFGNVRVTGAT